MSGPAPHRKSGDWVIRPAGSNASVEPRTPLVVFEPGLPAPRVLPTEPLGPWALGPLERVLRAADRDRPLVLDLRESVGSPGEVAAVLWADDMAHDLGVELEVV